MNKRLGAAMLAMLAGACSKTPQQPLRRPTPVVRETPPKPRPTVDPKSNAAAEELVRGFVGLINSGRFDDAYMLLGPNAPSRTDFDRQFAVYAHLRATPGAAGGQEGAAGSIYLSVPLTISGESGDRHVERSAIALLRRVNDVPGSTEAQRRWHIERIDWK